MKGKALQGGREDNREEGRERECVCVRERESAKVHTRERESSFTCWLFLQMATIGRAEPYQIKKPGTSPQSSTWMVVAQVVELSSTTPLGILSGRWTRSGATRPQIHASLWDASVTRYCLVHGSTMPSSSTNVLKYACISV